MKWQIQEIITQKTAHATAWVTSHRLNSAGYRSGRHWAKLYTGDRDWPEFDCFCRQAVLAKLVNSSGLVTLIDAELDCPQPLLVYTGLNAKPLSGWLAECSQYPAQSVLVWIIRQIAETLSAIHRAGFVHGHLNSSHVLIQIVDQSTRIIGLGQLEYTGDMSCLTRQATHFDAPERRLAEFEISSAADIYSIGVLMVEVLGARVLNAALLSAMLAENPQHRPTADELAGLLRNLEQKLFGEPFSAGNFRPLPHQAA